jgi:hypothetical protein
MSYAQIPLALGWDCSEYAVQHALRSKGFLRYHARRKPPISETNRSVRLAWAIEHLNWSIEQWNEVLWIDETWITPGSHRRT